MVRHKLDSVNDFARQGYNLRFTCDRCGRVVEVGAVRMMQELAQRHASQSIARLEERAKCRHFGHKGAAISAREINL